MSQSVVPLVIVIGVLGAFAVYSIQKFVRSFYTNTGLAVQRIVLSNKGTRLFSMLLLLNVVFTLGFLLRIEGIVAHADNFGIIIYLAGVSTFMLILAFEITRKWQE